MKPESPHEQHRVNGEEGNQVTGDGSLKYRVAGGKIRVFPVTNVRSAIACRSAAALTGLNSIGTPDDLSLIHI